MDSDPNMLLGTVAQVAATIVSILGGFLLTLVFSRLTDMSRLKLEFERHEIIQNEIEKEQGEVQDDSASPSGKLKAKMLSIQLQVLRGELTVEQENRARQEAQQELTAFYQDQMANAENRQQRLRIAKHDLTAVGAQIDLLWLQAKVMLVGLAILILLAIIGVGLPLYWMPLEQGDDQSHLVWFAQRGTIALLVLMIIYIAVVPLISSSEPFFDSKLDGFFKVLLVIYVVIFVLLPDSWLNWVSPLVMGAVTVYWVGSWAVRRKARTSNLDTARQSVNDPVQ